MGKRRAAKNYAATPPSSPQERKDTKYSLLPLDTEEKKQSAFKHLIRKDKKKSKKNIETINKPTTASAIQPSQPKSGIESDESNDSIELIDTPKVSCKREKDLCKLLEALTLDSDKDDNEDEEGEDSGDDTLKNLWLAPDEADITRRWLHDRNTFDPAFEISETRRQAIPEANGLKRLRYTIPIRSRDPIEQQAMIEDRAKFAEECVQQLPG